MGDRSTRDGAHHRPTGAFTCADRSCSLWLQKRGPIVIHPTPVARMGAVAWVGGFVLFFAAQLIVGAAWSNPPYSWAEDNVSDLGNVSCQPWVENGRAAHYVCSPLHT